MTNMYVKLSVTNMKNNRQFYLPYLLMGIITVAMHYTMVSLNNNQGLETIPGVADLRMILALGTYVIDICSVIFLFYTNSFIMKRRKKELGVYNILGMEKKHIARVLLVETVFQSMVSIFAGLIFGVAFNKLMMMLLYKLTGLNNSVAFEISGIGIRSAFILFIAIYVVIYIYNRMQVHQANPIELLRGGNVGEREPKTKLLMTIIGVVCLAAGYYIAITTKSPLDALVLFFVAVILVIIGTYALFTTGSIVLLKALRKNKKFYYQTKHFTAVSGMMYRMKQNAVGLSNICILSTMVLVMVSTTVSMFVGVDDELTSRYASEIRVTAYYNTDLLTAQQDQDMLSDKVETAISDTGRKITHSGYYYELPLTGLLQQDEVTLVTDSSSKYDEKTTVMMYAMTWADYQQMNPEAAKSMEAPAKGSVNMAGTQEYPAASLNIEGSSYEIDHRYQFDDTKGNAAIYDGMVQGIYYIITPDDQMLNDIYQLQATVLTQEGRDVQSLTYNMAIDIDGTKEEKLICEQHLIEAVNGISAASGNGGVYSSLYIENRQTNEAEFYTIYGGLFFIGLFLGSMFLLVTVLIIFYKQISEGYEDKERFAIMEKVGMSNQEVKASISSQIIIVFFLPLLTACIHVFAAFPMIKRILSVLNLTNGTLFFCCMLATIAVFAIIYYVVFKLTSRNYYNIVGEQV